MTPAEYALRDLIAVSERMRDVAGYVKGGHSHYVTSTEWKMWTTQLKAAKRLLAATQPDQE